MPPDEIRRFDGTVHKDQPVAAAAGFAVTGHGGQPIAGIAVVAVVAMAAAADSEVTNIVEPHEPGLLSQDVLSRPQHWAVMATIWDGAIRCVRVLDGS